jgi:predicted nucleotidyltransferase
MSVDDIAAILRAYSAERPSVLRTYIYGSRISGNPRPDSDVDIAMELDPAFRPADWNVMVDWLTEHEKFRQELQELISLPVHHTHFYTGMMTDYVEESARAGLLVYER